MLSQNTVDQFMGAVLGMPQFRYISRRIDQEQNAPDPQEQHLARLRPRFGAPAYDAASQEQHRRKYSSRFAGKAGNGSVEKTIAAEAVRIHDQKLAAGERSDYAMCRAEAMQNLGMGADKYHGPTA